MWLVSQSLSIAHCYRVLLVVFRVESCAHSAILFRLKSTRGSSYQFEVVQDMLSNIMLHKYVRCFVLIRSVYPIKVTVLRTVDFHSLYICRKVLWKTHWLAHLKRSDGHLFLSCCQLKVWCHFLFLLNFSRRKYKVSQLFWWEVPLHWYRHTGLVNGSISNWFEQFLKKTKKSNLFYVMALTGDLLPLLDWQYK